MMAPRWRLLVSRLSEMSWHELQTRVRQEVNKRVDLAIWGSGLAPSRNRLRLAGPERGEFFFPKQDLPRLAQILKDWLPGEVAEIVRNADQVCRHRFSLLGFEGLDFGQEIDWHLDPVHGKRASLKPWFEIDFLDFDQVGDHKVIWELNRHQHLVTLAKAWCLTQEKSYVSELISQWYSWRRANPYPRGVNWGSSLEVAFRSLSWIWIHHLTAGCSEVPAEFEADLLHGLATAGRHIERYLSTYFSPNTHLLGEAVALLFIGVLYPQLGPAKRWRNKGWQLLVEQSERQVRCDGVHFEQSSYYHVYALDFFLHARVLASKNAIEVPVSFDRTILKMLDFVRALSQTGTPQGFGDDDGGRVFNPLRNRPEHMSDPLAVGGALFHNVDLLSAATLTEESVWLLGDAASVLGRRQATPNPVSRSFEAAGIYLMADAARGLRQLMADGGPQGPGRSGHGHADALSIQLSLDGKPWLIDSGTGCYISGDDTRDRFRGTAAHNTLWLDGLDQAVSEAPFAWTSLPTVEVEQWIQGKRFNLFVGSHSGYMRLADPVDHRRFIFHLVGNFWLIRDLAEGRQVHSIATLWHFHPAVSLTNVGNNFITSDSKRQPGAGNGQLSLALVPLEDNAWTSEIITEQISPAYGRFEPAPVLRFSTRGTLPAEFALVLNPQSGSDEAGALTRVTRAGGNGAAPILQYETKDGAHFLIFPASSGEWAAGVWTGDASFLYYYVTQGRIRRFIVCNSSFAAIGSSCVFRHPSKVEWLDWRQSAGEGDLLTSEKNAVQSFSESVLTSCSL
jgi:hypothetical protein